MNGPESNLDALLRSMQPVLNGGIYVYCMLPRSADMRALDVIASIREEEGITVVMEEAAAIAAGLTIRFRAAWITLKVRSALDAVGFTAAFSRALGDAGISCNVVAAVHHDHLFVPVERAKQALDCLRELQRVGCRTT